MGYTENVGIYNEALKEAAWEYAQMKDPLDEVLFPIWRDGVHEIMKLEGCACTLNNAMENQVCFMRLNREEQIRLFKDVGVFSYHKFIDILKQGKEMALDS